MTARYWVLVSDELVAARMQLPHGLRDTGTYRSEHSEGYLPQEPPGTGWHLIEDDDAPADLDGRIVELVFRSEGGTPVLAGREVVR
jgi:hypothetical protein